MQAVNGQQVQKPEITDTGCCGKALEDHQNVAYGLWCSDFCQLLIAGQTIGNFLLYSKTKALVSVPSQVSKPKFS